MRERLVPLTLFGSCVAWRLFAFVVLYIRLDRPRPWRRARSTLSVSSGATRCRGLPNRLLFAERLDQELGRLARSAGGLR
jgi:hypothetical protein